jgi:GNAT superfamily N-acetyltransferase
MRSEAMELKRIEDKGALAEAAEISARAHRLLRQSHPWLPERAAGQFRPRLEWILDHGVHMGLYRDGELAAFLGGFVIEDFRNAGPGAFSPDWCHGVRPDEDGYKAYRLLYRGIAEGWARDEVRIHAAGVYATDEALSAALLDTGFGRITMDAAQPTAKLLAEPEDPASLLAGTSIRRATIADAAALGALSDLLAVHIGSSPVFVPRTKGPSVEEWVFWLAESDTVAFVAEGAGGLDGFIKAQAPQFDVSFSVHSEKTLAINGMYVRKELRGAGLGTGLLGAIARFAADAGKPLVSVDCETTNLEAFGFWTRFFAPFSWGMERRI